MKTGRAAGRSSPPHSGRKTAPPKSPPHLRSAVHNDAGKVRQGQQRHVVCLPPEREQFFRPRLGGHRLRRHREVRFLFLRPRQIGGRRQLVSFNELVEFQLQKQRIQRVGGRLAQILPRLEGKGCVGEDGRQMVRLPGAGLPLRQLFDDRGPGLDFRQGAVNGVDRLIFSNQLHRRLFADAGDAGIVVAAVAHQGF